MMKNEITLTGFWEMFNSENFFGHVTSKTIIHHTMYVEWAKTGIRK
jgi:hypothetical protein